jgi:nicotinamide phosphoribosyltransferase
LGIFDKEFIMTHNFILNTDSYKCSHWLQYPANTKNVFSYVESRGGKYAHTVFFGLQMYLKEYLTKPITQEMIDEADRFLKIHGEPFNREGWEYILKEHNGYLPLRIHAVDEGRVIPTHNVLVTVEATDPKCYWLVSYIETSLLRAVWYPTTVATISWTIKQIISKYLNETGDPAGISFKLHDFGARGVSSQESAGIGGAAHLTNFMGTDTIEGALTAMRYYNCDVPAFSIPAAEHSTITAFGKDGEVDAYRNMLKQYGQEGKLVAVVSDSYDIYNAVSNIWGKQLRDEVIASGATVVIRPDSGHPATVVLEVAKRLDAAFGSTFNTKGFKVLNHVRIIQGDGVNEDSIRECLEALKQNGFSADNIAFGMGGALLQRVDRDTQKFAMKASAIKVDGAWVDVFKDPVTDPGKKSKKGRLTLIKDMTGIHTVTLEQSQGKEKLLHPVFENGKLIKDWTFDEVRENTQRSI